MSPVYNPYYPQNYMQNYMIPNQQTAQQNQQIQNGGFVSVRAEGEVYNYPVAPGNCVTFKVEGQPIVLEKSMGFSQLEAPKVRRYRLVEEDTSTETQGGQITTKMDQIDNTNYEEVKEEIKALWSEINAIKESKRSTNSRKKDEGGD